MSCRAQRAIPMLPRLGRNVKPEARGKEGREEGAKTKGPPGGSRDGSKGSRGSSRPIECTNCLKVVTGDHHHNSCPKPRREGGGDKRRGNTPYHGKNKYSYPWSERRKDRGRNSSNDRVSATQDGSKSHHKTYIMRA